MNYPDMESFEIRVTERWIKSDLFKTTETVITSPASLNYFYKYARCQSQAERDWHSKDFSDLLRLCYGRRLGELTMRKPIRYDGTMGDDREITIHAVCKIKYREGSSGGQKSDAKS